MTDKSELKLADGSRWDGDSVVENDGVRVEVFPGNHCPAVLRVITNDDELSCCFVADALAAIRAVDGDPEYLVRNRLRTHLASLGFSADEVDRIATGNEIESDYICPQTLNLQVELDRQRTDNDALTARCNDLLAKQSTIYNDGFEAGLNRAR